MKKEMVYTSFCLKKPIVIAKGKYRGLRYFVLNLGTHPCAYVDVAKTKLRGIDYGDLKIDIDCHGGITYSDKNLLSVKKEGWYIGWDYAHGGDFCGCFLGTAGYYTWKMWSTKEMIAECKKVIDQIKSEVQGE